MSLRQEDALANRHTTPFELPPHELNQCTNQINTAFEAFLSLADASHDILNPSTNIPSLTEQSQMTAFQILAKLIADIQATSNSDSLICFLQQFVDLNNECNQHSINPITEDYS